jgi:hypothetical protein
MVKKRPAITLFITLAVIVAMLSLIGIVFGYLSEAKTKARDKSALIESNLIYADAVETLKSFLGKKPTKNTLKNIYDIPLAVNETKGSFSMMVACTPACAAVPITWLNRKKELSEASQFAQAANVFEALTTKANIKDAQLLLNLISQALEKETQVLFGVEARLKHKTNYLSYTQFKSILTEYRLQTGDESVYNINWQSYFAFGEECKAIDGDFLSAELISVLFGIDEQIVQEDFQSGHLREFLQTNGADMDIYNSKAFAKKPLVAMKCTISYTFAGGNYSFNFKYTDGKVDSFEFN